MPTLRTHGRQPPCASVVDPRLVLPLLGERALWSLWQVAGVARFDEPLFATGDGAGDLEALCQSSNRVSRVLLNEICGRVRQIIWGEFSAYDDGEGTPWVILRAIDSSWCEVETDDVGVLDRVRETFAEVRTCL